MNLDDFDKWSFELRISAEGVEESVSSNLDEVKEILDRPHLPAGAPNHSAVAVMQFRQITKMIQRLMANHDKVLMSLGSDPEFYSRDEFS